VSKLPNKFRFIFSFERKYLRAKLGFDPASEDDMDDNGMSRYMENNDEEGWD